jgi:serine phosphatase RsbU (regulator of sigma subunit)
VHIDKEGRALCGRDTCPLHRSIVTGQKSECPILIFAKRADGSRVPVEASVAPLRDCSGAVVGGIEVFRDMSATIDDLNTARLIQRNALQSTLPTDPRVIFSTHYVPHDLVGGDFFRIEPLDSERYAVIVADLTGHGVSAALYVMQIRSLWEAHRAELDDPARFMGALNAGLHALSRPNDYFATAVYAVLNVATGRVAYARAGHEAPLLVLADGTVTKLNQRGAGLGLLPGTKYAVGEFDLEPGDSLLLYTDGAVEICNAEGVELGVEGLMRLVGGNRLRGGGNFLARLDEALLAYSNAIRLPDDLTLVCVQRPLLVIGSPAPSKS